MQDSQEIQHLLNHEDPQVAASAVYVVATLDKRRKVMAVIHESLIQLRLDVKYMVFDLESTRIERDGYKARLAKYEKP
jgi:hypothetical protein